jgi:phosphoserine phosphatase RsbU/P
LALAEVKTLQGFLPICSYCKRVRDDENYWHSVEAYITKHTDATFSHGICPGCYAAIEREWDDGREK